MSIIRIIFKGGFYETSVDLQKVFVKFTIVDCNVSTIMEINIVFRRYK